MQYFYHKEPSSLSSPKAVIIVVLIVIILLVILLAVLYYKRSQLTDFLLERRKARSGLEFSEYPTKLTANPDFMASLAPTWPEPEPDPTEDEAFIQQQVTVSVVVIMSCTLVLTNSLCTHQFFYLTFIMKYGLEKGRKL